MLRLRCWWQEIPCDKSASSTTQFSSLVFDQGQIKLFMSGKEFGGKRLFQRAWNIERAGQGNSPSQQNLLVQDSELHQSDTQKAAGILSAPSGSIEPPAQFSVLKLRNCHLQLQTQIHGDAQSLSQHQHCTNPSSSSAFHSQTVKLLHQFCRNSNAEISTNHPETSGRDEFPFCLSQRCVTSREGQGEKGKRRKGAKGWLLLSLGLLAGLWQDTGHTLSMERGLWMMPHSQLMHQLKTTFIP